ncbi:hypothetical protein [Burkholderia arboris]|uniref:hypothetical protein n=1 Tax=Burkholderia arboris TaxID=488730 RepID=UPI0030F220DA
MYSAADLFLHSYAASRWLTRQMLVVFLFAPGIVSVFSVRYSLIRPFDTLDVQIASRYGCHCMPAENASIQSGAK